MAHKKVEGEDHPSPPHSRLQVVKKQLIVFQSWKEVGAIPENEPVKNLFVR